MRKIFLTALLMAAAVSNAVWAEDVEPAPHRLFHIERNKNTNIVVYDAHVTPEGDLTEEDPVTVYWLKLAEGGDREELKGIEKKKAYGFKVESREGNRLELKMVADIGRNLVVKEHVDQYRAFIEIAGQQAILGKIFIFAKETKLLPKVEYIELFGTSVETGEEVYEKYLP